MLKKFRSPLGLALILNSLLIVFLIFRFGSLPPEIPLFYSERGDSVIAKLPFIIVLPITSFILIIFNSLILKKFYPTDQFVERVLYFVNIIIVFSLAFVFLKILLLIS